MLMKEERELIVQYGKKLVNANLTTGTGGNLSIINRDLGLVVIKPSGVDYFQMVPEDVVVIDIDGKVVEGHRKPSSEVNFHLALLKARTEMSAVIHTHQVYCTTIACLGWELPAVHYLVGFAGNKVPIAPYATFGTKQLADNIVNAIGNYNATLMANHGVVVVGPTIDHAFATCEELELVARLYYQTKCVGQPNILSDEEMVVITEKFKTYGQNTTK